MNGCMRPLFDGLDAEYIGLDIEAGPNVDVVMNEPYKWDNLEDESFDFVISANAFEHIEFPWLTIKEIYRKLKQGGFACIHAPLSIPEHRYPVDCYRYYPDGFRALGKWGGFQVISATVGGVPSMSAPKEWDEFNDSLMILLKSDKPVNPDDYPVLKYERRIEFVGDNASISSIFHLLIEKDFPSYA
ncbi:MAG: class I SAM-dependent methyltransferase [Synergistaceae bacterium]|nr:class I SAM-dependent methyltransferase [Synergistaceae bacterium]